MKIKFLAKWILVGLLTSTMLVLAINSFSEIAKQEKLVKIGKCIEVWQETKVDAADPDNVKWYLYAGNKCEDLTTLDRSLTITRASNVTVIQGDVFDLHKMIVPARDRKLVMVIMKLQPFAKAQFAWQITR